MKLNVQDTSNAFLRKASLVSSLVFEGATVYSLRGVFVVFVLTCPWIGQI